MEEMNGKETAFVDDAFRMVTPSFSLLFAGWGDFRHVAPSACFLLS